MSTTSGPNPLRPYYIPPANDYLLDTLSTASEAYSKTSHALQSATSSASSGRPSTTSIFTSTAKDLLSDLDYSDYIETSGDSPSTRELLTNIAVRASMKYTLQAVGQPFEVAVMNLQCMYMPKKSQKKKPRNVFGGGSGEENGRRGRTGGRYDDEKDNDDNASVYSDDSEPAYFSSTISEPSSPSLQATSSRPRRVTDRSGYVLDTPDVEDIRPPWELEVSRSGEVWDMIKALWKKEGAWGIWKGQNASFIHWVLTSTVESWTRSLLSAILSIPDPGFADIADSPYPLMSIGVAVAASTVTAIVLAPLDIVRTRLMITPSNDTPRNILPHLRSLPHPNYLIPAYLLPPTLLHATLPSLITHGKPFFIRHKLGIDPIISPNAYSFFNFLGTLAARVLRLPLALVLRRAQADVMKPQRTIVPLGRYAGIIGTMWLVVKEEEVGGEKGGSRLGGVEGLFRGWRMEVWPEVGLMLLGMVGLGGYGAGAEAAAEGF